MLKLKQTSYCLCVFILCSCGTFRESIQRLRESNEGLKENVKMSFSAMSSNTAMLIAFLGDSASSIHKENAFDSTMNVYIYSLNASFSGNRWSPFNVSIDSIEMEYCSSIIAANKLWQIDTLTASFSDERSIPFYKMYLGIDTLSVAVKCAYDYDNNRDSLRVFTSSHILNGDISDGGNLLRLNHDGNRDALLPLSKEQRVPVNNKDDYSVEYKLNKKGDWEITKSPH